MGSATLTTHETANEVLRLMPVTSAAIDLVDEILDFTDGIADELDIAAATARAMARRGVAAESTAEVLENAALVLGHIGALR